MYEVIINYPSCKFCRYAEMSAQDERRGLCHFDPPIYIGVGFVYPDIYFETGGCNRMQPIKHNINDLIARDDFHKIGNIVSSASNPDEKHWLPVDNSELDINEYSELFAIIGTDYGTGDKPNTFKLPDARDQFGGCLHFIRFSINELVESEFEEVKK